MATLAHGRETKASAKYRKAIRLQRAKWSKRNGFARAAIMEACAANPTAIVIILENRDATAKELYEKVLKRFEQRQTSAIQSKLAEFNGLVIRDDEGVEDFINRILTLKIMLDDMGEKGLSHDVHCLGRLKAGLLNDQ